MKNQKKVRAGRKGGKASSGNWSLNPEAARRAGRRSAWIRSGGKLKDFPIELCEEPLLPIISKPSRRKKS